MRGLERAFALTHFLDQPEQVRGDAGGGARGERDGELVAPHSDDANVGLAEPELEQERTLDRLARERLFRRGERGRSEHRQQQRRHVQSQGKAARSAAVNGSTTSG